MTKATTSVRLGYEVGTGDPVDIPLGQHMCVTGQTQLSGKTTLLEGIMCQEMKDRIVELEAKLAGLAQVIDSGAKPITFEYGEPTNRRGDGTGVLRESEAADFGTGAIVKIEALIDSIVERVLADPRLRVGGTVTVEPKIAVLKHFMEQEVTRIVEQADQLTPWQRDALRLVEAKETRMAKAEILSAITGKTANLVKSYKEKYAELDELATRGFLRHDTQKRFYPNLAKGIASRLAAFNPTEADVEAVVSQVLARLK